VPTGKYLAHVYKLFHETILPHLNKEVKKRGAITLHWDVSYKSSEHLTQMLGEPFFKGLVTAMDELEFFCRHAVSHTAIEDVDVSGAGGNAMQTLADSLPRALMLNPRLRRVQLPVRTLGQLRIVASALESPNSSLEELSIRHEAGFGQPAPTNTEVTAILLALALQMNLTLKRLHYMYCGYPGGVNLDWPILLTLLCGTSSIEATINSNHTLELLSSNETAVPLEISLLLRMNQKSEPKQALCGYQQGCAASLD
jgi:hypothetical protein